LYDEAGSSISEGNLIHFRGLGGGQKGGQNLANAYRWEETIGPIEDGR